MCARTERSGVNESGYTMRSLKSGGNHMPKCFVCGDVVREPENFIDDENVLCERCAKAETDSLSKQFQCATK